jgi:hypothetical protein
MLDDLSGVYQRLIGVTKDTHRHGRERALLGFAAKIKS